MNKECPATAAAAAAQTADDGPVASLVAGRCSLGLVTETSDN